MLLPCVYEMYMYTGLTQRQRLWDIGPIPGFTVDFLSNGNLFNGM
jgi:hypothetical protein